MVHPFGDAAYFLVCRAVNQLMSLRNSVPNFIVWLFWLLVAIIVIVIAAAIVHHFGGFSLSFHIGYFNFDVGVS
jgi:cytochrome b561